MEYFGQFRDPLSTVSLRRRSRLYSRWLLAPVATLLLAGCADLASEQAAGEEAAGEETVNVATEALVGGERSYVVRIQAVVTADDNGANMSPMTQAMIVSRVSAMNTIYASTGVSFVFDPATDLDIVNSTLLNQRFALAAGVDLTDYQDANVTPPTTKAAHDAARIDYANDHFGKVTVFFALPKALEFSTTLGHWVLVTDNSGGTSAGEGRSVNWRGTASSHSLAHEVGHYLHQLHPFVDSIVPPKTIEEAADIIKSYVQAGHSRADGMNVFDGDRSYVLDTVPDVRGDLIENANTPKNKCGPVGTVTIPVEFAPGDIQTYTAAPDRTLVMSYFNGCFDDRFTLDQGTRMRESLELLNRRDLVSLPDSISASLQETDSTTGGVVSSYDAAFIGNGHIVTSAIEPDNDLRLVVWQVDSNGDILQRGAITPASNVGQVALSDAGLSQVVTFSTSPGGKRQNFRTFKVDTAGNISLKGLTFVEGQDVVTGVGIERFDRLRFITTTESGGNVNLRGWRVVADGTTTAGASAVVAGSGSLGRLARTAGGAMLYYRGSDTHLKRQYWQLNSSLTPEQDGSSDAEAMNALEGASLGIERSASIVGLGSASVGTPSQQKVILWDRDSTSGVITRRGSYTASSTELCAKIASAPIGTSYLATGCVISGSGELRISLFRVASGTPVLASSFIAGIVSDVKLAHVGNDTLVAVTTNGSGQMQLTSWKVTLN